MTVDDCIAKLDPPELRDALRARSPGPVFCHSDRRLSVSANRVRGLLDGAPFVAVAGSVKTDDQVRGFIDALYWQLTQAPDAEPHYFVGRRDSTDQLLQALASLNACIRNEHQVVVHVDGERARLHPPDFSSEKPQWLELLRRRDRLLDDPPPLVRELAERVNRDDFRWHLTVRAQRWSGRIGGLRVCEVALDESRGTVAVGTPGSGHPAARAFRELSAGPVDFDTDGLERAAELIRAVASRGPELGDPEHRLEDQILQEHVTFSTPTGAPLRPALAVSQFPAVWWEGDRANRYTDLLLREDTVPWVVEVKVATKGQGQYYRHAIGQVALYRHFIREPNPLRPWFDERSLDARKCRAAIAFPALRGARARRLSEDLKVIAAAFDVAVIEIRD